MITDDFLFLYRMLMKLDIQIKNKKNSIILLPLKKKKILET